MSTGGAQLPGAGRVGHAKGPPSCPPSCPPPAVPPPPVPPSLRPPPAPLAPAEPELPLLPLPGAVPPDPPVPLVPPGEGLLQLMKNRMEIVSPSSRSRCAPSLSVILGAPADRRLLRDPYPPVSATATNGAKRVRERRNDMVTS